MQDKIIKVTNAPQVQAELTPPNPIKVKNPVGRPTKYKEEYAEQLLAYFSIPPYIKVKEVLKYRNGIQTTRTKYVANDLPLFGMFAVKVGVWRDILLEWCKKHKKFNEAYNKAKELQESFIVQNTIKGLYNPAFAIFTAKNILGWRDTQDITTTGTNSTINLVSYGEQDPLKKYMTNITPQQAVKAIKSLRTEPQESAS